MDEDSELDHLRGLVAKLRREVEDLRAAKEIEVRRVPSGRLLAVLVDDLMFAMEGSTNIYAIGNLVATFPERFNIKITEIHE